LFNLNPFKRERSYRKSVDLKSVVSQLETYLKSDRWKVQPKVEGNKAVHQAQKAGILRDIIAADRVLAFTFESSPGEVKVTARIGRWSDSIRAVLEDAAAMGIGSSRRNGFRRVSIREVRQEGSGE
jgi:predicted RNA-binding protein with PUA domain